MEREREYTTPVKEGWDIKLSDKATNRIMMFSGVLAVMAIIISMDCYLVGCSVIRRGILNEIQPDYFMFGISTVFIIIGIIYIRMLNGKRYDNETD